MPLTGRRPDQLPRSRPALALSVCLALALVIPAADNAGYTPQAQAVVIALAGVALLTAALVDNRAVLANVGRGPVRLLVGFGLLSSVSAAWTLGRPVDSIRWGLVVLAYAALALSGAALARQPHGIALIACAIAGLALAEAVVGLSAAALRHVPDAERIAGSWHPGGTFEYSSALALLQVVALPPLLSAMAVARRTMAGLAALACVLGLGTVLLAESRAELALAAVVAVVPLVWPQQTTLAPRAVTIGGLVMAGGGGLLVSLVVGGYTTKAARAGGDGRLLEVAAIALLAALFWPALRTGCRRVALRTPPRRVRTVAATVTATAVVGGILLAVVGGQAPAHGRGVEPYGGVLHGRGNTWKAALDTFGHRPLLGGGSDAFLAASFEYQGAAPVLYAHDLPLEAAAELGVLGGLLMVGLYLNCGLVAWRARSSAHGWLLIPGMLAFIAANLVDWEWHLPLSGTVWAIELGAILVLAPRVPTRDRAGRRINIPEASTRTEARGRGIR